jgi:hypothetical protein
MEMVGKESYNRRQSHAELVMPPDPNSLSRYSESELQKAEEGGRIWRVTPQRCFDLAVESGMVESANFWRDEVELQKRLMVDNEFWSDLVARLKREKKYMEAAVICRQEMPLPAAYRDFLICLRKLLEYRQGEARRAVLRELYAYAVEAYVLHRVPSVELETQIGKHGYPGFNVALIVWKRLMQKPLALNYNEVGYDYVTTLNRTDRTCIANAFGKPATHRDPFLIAKPLWDEGVSEFARRKEQTDREMRVEMQKLLNPPPIPIKKMNWLQRLLGRG